MKSLVSLCQILEHNIELMHPNDKTKKQIKRNLQRPVYSNKVTELQCRILEELGRYMYLTNSQMLYLGVGTTWGTYLSKQLRSLAGRKKPLIFSKGYDKPNPKKGREENLYRLTPEGKDYVVDELRYEYSMVKYGKSANAYPYRDYFHRTGQVWFTIELYQWAETKRLDISFFDADFDKFGSNRGGTGQKLTSRTRIEFDGTFFRPDGIFSIVDSSSKENYYALEYFADRNNDRMIDKLKLHAEAMVYRAIHRKYGWEKDKSYKVILFFRYKASMVAVQNELRGNLMYNMIMDFFLFKSWDDMQDGGDLSVWVNAKGEQIKLFE